MRYFMLLALSLSFGLAHAAVNYDAPHNVVLDAVFQGTVLSDYMPADPLYEAKTQFEFTEGQLNEISGVSQLARTEYKLLGTDVLEGGKVAVKYEARSLIAWPRELEVPATRNFVFPAFASGSGRQEFEKRYLDSCSSESGGSSAFFYHFRPENYSCPLRKEDAAAEAGVVARMPIALSVSAQNTEGKSPEYAEIWKDGLLKVTIIFSKTTSGATDDYDGGVSAYNGVFQALSSIYGEPKRVSERFTGLPGAAHPDLELGYETGRGKVQVWIHLSDEVAAEGSAFVTKFSEWSKTSDVVIYNGHAGLGANVRALERWVRAEKGRYQIYMINGCDTFAYATEKLFKIHAEANPGEKGSRYVDVILNAMPSYFSENERSTRALLGELENRKLTYREILAQFDMSQRVIVDGEEDNRWPDAF